VSEYRFLPQICSECESKLPVSLIPQENLELHQWLPVEVHQSLLFFLAPFEPRCAKNSVTAKPYIYNMMWSEYKFNPQFSFFSEYIFRIRLLFNLGLPS